LNVVQIEVFAPTNTRASIFEFFMRQVRHVYTPLGHDTKFFFENFQNFHPGVFFWVCAFFRSWLAMLLHLWQLARDVEFIFQT